MNVVLVDMSAADFATRRVQLMRDSVEALVADHGMSVAEAESRAGSSIATSFPDGPASAGQILRSAVASDGAVVGWIWVAMPGYAVPGMAWIGDLVVDEPFRRQGYGAAILAAAEDELMGRGIGRVGLHVYGSNRTARRLYERQSYGVIRQVRARRLSDPAARSPAGIMLTPITPAEYERRIAITEAEYPPERQVRRSMPRGPATEGMVVRTAVAGDAEIGWVWYGLRGPVRPDMAWIYQLDVDEPYRNRGHGTAIIAAVEADLVRRGARTVGLYVRGDNVDAQRLYERLGFQLVSQEMSKPLPAP
jgi:mycothiol synthase